MRINVDFSELKVQASKMHGLEGLDQDIDRFYFEY